MSNPKPKHNPHLRLFGLAWLTLLLLTQCIMDQRHAGTSTSVTNPAPYVTGFAILNDGRPAAGALISLRKPIIEVSYAGVPTSKQVAFTTADSVGRFTVPLVFLDDVYMEIREAPGSRRGLSLDSQEVHLRRWPNGLPLDGKMGTFRLEAPATITGELQVLDTSATIHTWIGVRGTDNFAATPDNRPFILKGVSAGRRELVVVTVPDTSVWGANPQKPLMVADSVVHAELKSGSNTDFGPIYYNND